MKKIIAIAALMFTVSLTSAQNQGERYMFTGKLISTPSSSADCGTLAMAGVYEFQVTMISDDSYTSENIAIVVTCPELLGDNFFKVDATYKMELFSENGTQYGINNEDVLNNYTLAHNYWAGDIKRVD